MYCSMALLLVSTVQGIGLIGSAVKVMWLISFALLTVVNAGAAVGVYVAALALYSVVHLDGFGRLDHYALLIVAAGLALRLWLARSVRRWDRSLLIIGGFLAYGLLQTASLGLLNRSLFVIYLWMPGLPMLMFLLLSQCGLPERELRTLLRALLVLGAYMALVSITEALGWYQLIVPAWIVDPTVTSILPGLGIAGDPRSGGLLMQPAWNGLALSLIFCVAVFSTHWSRRRRPWFEGVVGLLCVVGVFLSYTRAAWIGCALASIVLFWRPSATPVITWSKRLAVVGACAACFGALALMPNTAARQRIDDSGTVLYRLNLWKAAISMVADRPLVGTGYNTFAGNLDDYRQEMTVGGHMNIDNDAAHNTLLSMTVELGVIGLVLYVGSLVVIVRKAKRAALRAWGRGGAVWVSVFFWVYFVQAQFAVTHEPTTNLIFFGVMGAIAGLVPAGFPREIPRMSPALLHATADGGSR